MLKSNLVIQTAFLGDLILSIPTLRRIKEIFPDDKLIVLCKSGLGEFLIKEHIVDAIIEIEKSNAKSYQNALVESNKYNIRNVFCLHRSVRSQLFAAKIKAEKKIGFSSFLGFWIFDDLVDYRAENPEVIRQFAILETIDSRSFTEINSQDYSYLNSSEMPVVPPFFSFVQQVRNESRNKIAIFPGSVWATKKWTTAGFTELAELLVKDNYQIDLLGGASEKILCEEIAAKVSGVNVLAGSCSIAETIQLLAGYDLVISNDSAPTHMAAYNNIPVVTIFGPTTLKQGFRPWSNNAYVIENNQLTCRPCGKHGHNVCPLAHHNCMKSISAIMVYQQVKKILKFS